VQLWGTQRHWESARFSRETSLTAARQFVDGQYDKVEEELEELDESHDGEAEPQAEHTAQVRDVLQQLKHSYHVPDYTLFAPG